MCTQMTYGSIGRQCFRRLATVAKTVCRRLVGRVIRTTRRELSATAVAKGYIICIRVVSQPAGDATRRKWKTVAGRWVVRVVNGHRVAERKTLSLPPAVRFGRRRRLCDAHGIFRIQLSRH